MPGFLSKLKDIFKKEGNEKEPLSIHEETLELTSEAPKLTERAGKLLKAHMKPIELYPLYQPWAYAHIVEDLKTGNLIYLVEEVSLNQREKEVFKEIIDYITWKLEPPSGSVDLHEYLLSYARKAIRMFQIRLGRTPGLSWSKIGYYIERDLLGYGKLDPIFRDENIEDISCNGPAKPVYVWHRKYESLPTNIVFKTSDELDEYVLKLAHMAGKHISVAYPILDAILPGGHRVAATFQKEVSTAGSTFTVRKFREDPITIIDLINYGTISPELAAYFWLAMDYKMTSLILGVTGAGKSVSGRMRLLVKMRGSVKEYSIEELWSYLRNKAISLGDGIQLILNPKILIRSCNPRTLECGWFRPRALIKHVNNRRMFRIKLKSGNYVDVTEDHSLLILKGRRLVEVKPSESLVGQELPTLMGSFARANGFSGFARLSVGGKQQLSVSQLKNPIQEGIVTDEVTEVTKIPPEKFVFDFDVPETQNFEANNVLVHNTSTLNALANLLRPTYKVVTIEDTPELRLPQENWVQLVSRPSYLGGGGAGEITLFHLVKVSLRYRPDVIIVGEVRGEEAYVLFQAVASVSWDTPVLLRDKEGNIKLTPIGAFIDKFYNEGEERKAKKVEGYEVLSHEGHSVVWKPIRYVLRHKTDEIYTIEYEGGGSIKATGSHSVFVMDPETLEVHEKPVRDIKPGEFLVTFRRKTSNKTEQGRAYVTIDVIDEVGDPSKDYLDRIPKHIKRKTGRNPVKLGTYLAYEGSKKEREKVFVRRWMRSKKIPALIDLDEDLAFVFGAYIANGRVYGGRGRKIVFSLELPDKEKVVNKIVEVMRKKFRLEPHLVSKGNHILLTYNNTLLAELFAKLLGRKKEGKRIPSALFRSPESVVTAFFKGLKSDAGRTPNRRRTFHITLAKEPAQELVWLARLHGLYATMHEGKGRRKKKGMPSLVSVYLSEPSEKPSSLKKVPTALLLKLIRVSGVESMPTDLTCLMKEKTVSWGVIEKVLGLVEKEGKTTEETKAVTRKLREFMSGNLIITEVSAIKKEPYRGYVYDISVPNSESFFGGNVPVLLHNTGHSGMTTLHAENLDAAVKRLTSPPMNIPPAYIPLVNFALVIKRLVLHKEGGKPRPIRRVTNVWEIRDYEMYDEIAKWDPVRDVFDVDLSSSLILEKIGDITGKGIDELIEEVSRRRAVLEWLATNNIRSYRDVAKYVQKYYIDPQSLLKEIGAR